MSDRDKTKLLTKIGFLWLKYHGGCTVIAPEVRVIHQGLKRFENPLENHDYIDLVGFQNKYVPSEKREGAVRKYISHTGERRFHEGLKYQDEVSKGIEIKVSRSDFRNGFIHNGCNYHYLLIPKGLVNKSEVTKGIGIIEVDLDTVKLCKRKHKYSSTSYWLQGVKIKRRPRRKKVIDSSNEFMIDQASYCQTGWIKLMLQDEMSIETHMVLTKND